eukprot:gene8734-18014_t
MSAIRKDMGHSAHRAHCDPSPYCILTLPRGQSQPEEYPSDDERERKD